MVAVGGPVIFAMNLLAIATFLINRHLRKKSIYLVINLAISDALNGAVFSPMMCNYLINIDISHVTLDGDFQFFPRSSDNPLSAPIRTFVVLTGVHLFTLTLISLERMFATVWPLRHRNSDPRMYVACCIVTWFVVVIFLLAAIAEFNVIAQSGALLAILALFIIAVSYLVIFIKVKLQHQQHNNTSQLAVQKERKLAMTLLLVILTSLLSWFPSLVLWQLPRDIQRKLSVVEHLAINLFCGLNPLWDPLIYMYRMPEYNKALKKLVCKCSRDRPNYVYPITN
ncbi:lysophosphatidic acid receptor 3 [Nematostella vectensis]|nr:lysophosphatidic acid receptor 3 [Nematostella vectensis]